MLIPLAVMFLKDREHDTVFTMGKPGCSAKQELGSQANINILVLQIIVFYTSQNISLKKQYVNCHLYVSDIKVTDFSKRKTETEIQPSQFLSLAPF